MKKMIAIIICLSLIYGFSPGELTVSSHDYTNICDVQQQIPNQECESLVDLFKTTKGDQWKNNSNWLKTNTPKNWYGLTIQNGHVIKINLANNGLSGKIPQSLRNLHYLQSIDLSSNDLEGNIQPSSWQASRYAHDQLNRQEIEAIHQKNLEGIPRPEEKISQFLEQRQEYLEISLWTAAAPDNVQPQENINAVDFDCTTVTDLVPEECNILKTLYESTIGENWTNATNWFTTTRVDDWFGIDTVDMHVQYIYLEENNLSGSIPAELGNLNNLQWLLLSKNELTGSIPVELGSLSDLTYLWLYNNQLSGSIPVELSNLNNLVSLYLYQNQLSGSIPPELGNLSNLQYFCLEQNQLSGSIPSSLGGLTKLIWLTLYNNQLTGGIPKELGNLTNLEYLYLYNNPLGGTIPSEIGNLNKIRWLLLTANQLTGEIPPELGNLLSAETIHLGSNLLSGSIPTELSALPKINRLYLFENQLTGSIPPELGLLLTLVDLQLDTNQLTGSIPPELGNLTNLRNLVLGWNQLSGDFPVALGALTNLGMLIVPDNNLTRIPSELGNLTNLVQANFYGNQISGSLPPELGNLPSIKKLDFMHNQLSGTIPATFGNLSTLETLFLSWNQLSGSIPPELGNMTNLKGLFLSENNLSGSLPSELSRLSNLSDLFIMNNAKLTGAIPLEFANLPPLLYFDFRYTGICEPQSEELSAWKATVTYWFSSGTTCGIDSPTNVAASDGTVYGKVRITFEPTGDGEYYLIFRNNSDNHVGEAQIGNQSSNQFEDIYSSAGITYYYWVRACNVIGCSDYSPVETGYWLAVPPSTPANLTASDGTYPNKISLSWDEADNATYYRIFRNTSDSHTEELEIVENQVSNAYDDFEVNSEIDYFYWVKACNPEGCSSYSLSDTGYLQEIVLTDQVFIPLIVH